MLELIWRWMCTGGLAAGPPASLAGDGGIVGLPLPPEVLPPRPVELPPSEAAEDDTGVCTAGNAERKRGGKTRGRCLGAALACMAVAVDAVVAVAPALPRTRPALRRDVANTGGVCESTADAAA